MVRSATSLLPDLHHGHHCCLIFTNLDDRVRITAPFLALGIERNERCLYVGDEASVEGVRAELQTTGIDVDLETRRNRLVLSSDRDYLEKGRFNTERMLSFLQQGYDDTIKNGFSALRAAGDVSWEVGPSRDFNEIVYYETLLDLFFLGKRMVGMCQYRRDDCPPETLNGILNSHRIAAIDNEICSNFLYVPPELLLEKDESARHAKRVEWMTSQLVRASKAEEEVHRINAELEARVKQRTAELEAANKDMESFSYSVSHDLRAPLRAIDGFAKVIEEDWADRLGPEGLADLGKIRLNAHRMGQLIDDLLVLARLSRVTPSMGKIDMEHLAGEAAREARAVAVIGKLPPAHADASLVRQLMVNLLSNAAKFSSKQANPSIEVGSTLMDGRCVYFVKDNGVGFHMEHASRLFSPFQRLHSKEEFEGTGVGLAIVSRIVKWHGGRVWVESHPGRGACFFFTLSSS